jgi:hypothetical protein
MDLLIYCANSLYLAAYFVRDMLLLRVFSLLAVLCLIGYFASRKELLVTVIAWNLVFALLNTVHVTRLALQRLNEVRGARVSAETR